MTDEIDWARVSEFQKALEEQEEQRKRRARAFDPAGLLEKAGRVYTLETDDHGTIRYGILTQKEWLELRRIEDRDEQTMNILWRTLRKGNRQDTSPCVFSLAFFS